MAAPVNTLRVVEFYSGIGGMHYALTLSGIPSTVVAAVDINDVANKVYKYNFPDLNLLQRNIQSVSLNAFSEWNADVFLMSPPCQPFTRVGLKGDKTDPRTSSFLHLLETIPKLTKKPDYILVENVKGFETSNTRDELVGVLKKCHYKFKEFLVSPTDVGVPNQRLRYFLLAKLSPLVFKESHLSDTEQCLLNHEIICNTTCCHSYQESVDKCSEGSISLRIEKNKTEISLMSKDSLTDKSASNESQVTHEPNIKGSASFSMSENTVVYQSNNISDYLESLSPETFHDYSVPDKLLLRFGKVMDIGRAEDARTCCFTKAYGHYVEGTGSFLQTNNSVTIQWAFQDNLDSTQTLNRLKELGVRYFTPREDANFHHFPREFDFPPEISRKQQYGVLGNSLNAFLVSLLLNYLVK